MYQVHGGLIITCRSQVGPQAETATPRDLHVTCQAVECCCWR